MAVTNSPSVETATIKQREFHERSPLRIGIEIEIEIEIEWGQGKKRYKNTGEISEQWTILISCQWSRNNSFKKITFHPSPDTAPPLSPLIPSLNYSSTLTLYFFSQLPPFFLFFFYFFLCSYQFYFIYKIYFFLYQFYFYFQIKIYFFCL